MALFRWGKRVDDRSATTNGVQIGRMGVIDPWPGRGVRDLTPYEMTPVANGGGLNYVVGIKVF